MLSDLPAIATCRTACTAVMALCGLLFSPGSGAQDRVHAVVPAHNAAATSPFVSPAVDTGNYLYISSQGPNSPDGTRPSTFTAQVQQALDNTKTIVEAAGLTMDHVVYAQ